MKRLVILLFVCAIALPTVALAAGTTRHVASWSDVAEAFRGKVNKADPAKQSDPNANAVVAGGAGAIPVDPCSQETIDREMKDSVAARSQIAEDQYKKAMDLSCLDKFKNLNIASSFGVFDATRLVGVLRNKVCDVADSIFNKLSAPVSTAVWSATNGKVNMKVFAGGQGGAGGQDGVTWTNSTYSSAYGYDNKVAEKIASPNLFK